MQIHVLQTVMTLACRKFAAYGEKPEEPDGNTTWGQCPEMWLPGVWGELGRWGQESRVEGSPKIRDVSAET